MGYFLGVDCQILHVPTRDDLVSETTVSALEDHFKNVGTPVMLGGDVKAFTIIGVDVSEEGNVKYLILDPHYTGSDSNTKEILNKGWCGWKDPLKHFQNGYFYNLCLPLIQ